MLTLGQLITPVTEDEALATILEILSEIGFNATSWQSGSIQLLTLQMMARVWSKLSGVIALIAAGGFTTLAATTDGGSPFLTLLAKYFYKIDRNEAQPTIGKFTLTSSAAAPLTTWAAGDIIVSDQPQGTDGANTYTVTAGGSLAPSSSISVEFKADAAGAAANIAPGTTLYLWTALVGITATNPALAPDSNTWITTPGQNEESDARLLLRCLGRWERLTYGNTEGAYRGWALEALPALTRVQVDSAPGDGTITIIGATDLGPIDAGQITTIEDYLNGVSDGKGRRPTNDIVSAVGASTLTTPPLVVTAYCLPEVVDSAKAGIAAKMLTFIGQQPLGGVKLTGSQGRILFDDLLDTAKRAVAGTRSVSLSISSDVLLSPGQIYLPEITVNVQPVAPGTPGV